MSQNAQFGSNLKKCGIGSMVNFMRYGITRTAVVATLGLAVLAAGSIIVTLYPFEAVLASGRGGSCLVVT